MKRKVSKLRLSPNEEARIIREEHERRRKLRIQQVREQQRYIALQIRREVEQRRQHELQLLEQELREAWNRQQNDKLHTLQRLYQESLQLVGQSHRSAKENEPDLAAVAAREEENRAKAEERYREALKELKTQKIRDHERQNQSVDARKKALQAEKERSAKVASLPPPAPNPIQNIDVKKPHVVRRYDPSAFATTRYHMLESIVEREAETAQPDAHAEAELEARRLQQLQEEEKRRREEQLERARVRGRQALRRERLVQDRERLLVELEHLQQMDLLRRRQQVSQMPPQIFQPLYKRQEIREDFQREMEFAFEDMHTRERRVKGDLVVQLVPEPLPSSSTGSQDQELDVTLDESSTPEAEHVQSDTEREAESTEQEASAEVEPSKPAPRRALRKLLDRIRNQRCEWVNSSSRVSDSPTAFTDQIPERDTSIESGSLPSEEKDKPTPIEVYEPTIPPSALELRNQAESSLPDVLVSKIQEFEEERKKREEELETEKRQQLFLLQELEEQKAKLEEMLLEAQQERDHLKAAVTQETILQQPREPAKNQELTPDSTTEPAPPAGEDDHTRRIREYQQRLLEQNRIHQRSVEVARQRLEEYQRALRIRHNMTTRSLLSVARPPTIIRLHGAQPDRLPAPLQPLTTPAVPSSVQNEPRTSEEVATRDSEASASPPRPASSSSVGAKMPSDESVSDTVGFQRLGVNAHLTDDIMKRVTEHLPERLRPSSASGEQLSSNHESTSSQPISDQRRAVSSSVGPGLVSREEDIKRRRRRLQEAQRRVKEQSEAVMQQQRLQEEERRRNEVELEQMRRQKETLQALIDTDEQHAPPPSCEELEAEDVGQQRMKLLASLLKVIEESNGGTLSHLEEPEENDDSLQRTLSASAGTAPVTQSSGATGPPQSPVFPFHPPRAPKPPVTRVKLGFKERMTEQHELSAIQEVETPVNMSHVTGQEGYTTEQDLQDESESFVSADRTLQTPSLSSSGQQNSERRFQSETSGHPPWRERLLSGAGTSPEQSDSDSILKKISLLSSDSGRGADFVGPAVSRHKSPTEPLPGPPDSDCFSTTVSSGSYVTTDPEQNPDTDKSLSFKRETGADLSDVASPCGQTLSVEANSAVGRPAPSVHSVFNDSSIQRIIDKYTRELNVSLGSVGTAGRTTEDENSAGGPSVPSHTTGAQRSVPDLEHFTIEDTSLSDQESFRPLTGHLTDQSSCLAADQRESVLEQLVGQPSAHSSMIGPLAGPPVSLSYDQAGWDSTLSRMIGRLAHQPGSHWLSPGQDLVAGQPVGRTALEPWWLDGSPEENRMRPLVGELDESEQHSGSSGESSCTDVGIPTEGTVQSDQTSSSHGTRVPDVAPRQRVQTSPVGVDSHTVEEGSDSFHPLEAEITHNETARPSVTFHLPEQNLPSERWLSVSTPSVGFEPSPEQLRTEEPRRCRTSPSFQESFSELVLTQCRPQESALTVSPFLKIDVEQNSSILSNSTTCCDAPAERTSQVSETHKDLDPVGERGAGGNQDSLPASDEIKEAAGEEGILEQSEITLVSLTDTTLQDEMVQEDHLSERGGEDEQLETEELISTSLAKETAEDDCPSRSGAVLEILWGPGKDLQDVFSQKRTALLQRSNRRVEEMKTKGAKIQPLSRDPVKGTEPVTHTARTSSEPQHENSQTKGGQAAQKTPQLPSSVHGSDLKTVDEVKICTPEQRKRNLSVMRRRTQRLYEQLEEVKQQKAVRNRQEDHAKNRQKAREFHKKTLQKLRAKQTR